MSDTIPRELLAAIIAAGLRASETEDTGHMPSQVAQMALQDADAILERVRADEEGGE